MDKLEFPSLPDACIQDSVRQNPWWQGQPLPPLPKFRRWPFDKIMSRLRQPIAPILVIRGPRQIGKTTLQQQVVSQLLAEGLSPRQIFRIQFDDLPSLSQVEASQEPILRMVEYRGWPATHQPLH
ncbi:MAG: AAA family ATPase [Verrucomicrobiota bacterium]